MAGASRSGIRVSAEHVASHPDSDPTCTEAVLNILAAANLITSRMDDLLRPLRLTPASFNLLQIVAGDPDPVTPSQIASRAPVPVTTATITGLLDTCERHGWITRRPHPTDRRRVLIHLTSSGAEVAGRAEALVLEAQRLWLAPTTEASRRRLTSALGDVVDHLRDGGDRGS